MQTFLPFQTMRQSLECLDRQRLGKQRVEAKQIFHTLKDGGGWRNHPAVKMWEGYEMALALYHNLSIKIWIERGYKNTMPFIPIDKRLRLPKWWGSKIHYSHQCNLYRKNPTHYEFYFNVESLNINEPYYWPTE